MCSLFDPCCFGLNCHPATSVARHNADMVPLAPKTLQFGRIVCIIPSEEVRAHFAKRFCKGRLNMHPITLVCFEFHLLRRGFPSVFQNHVHIKQLRHRKEISAALVCPNCIVCYLISGKGMIIIFSHHGGE